VPMVITATTRMLAPLTVTMGLITLWVASSSALARGITAGMVLAASMAGRATVTTAMQASAIARAMVTMAHPHLLPVASPAAIPQLPSTAVQASTAVVDSAAALDSTVPAVAN